MSAGLTLDAGALIALERSDRKMLVLLARAAERKASITIPATALAQVLRVPARQARLMKLLRQPLARAEPLDRASASLVGQLLAATRTTDIADAHVVICARRARQPVVTSDPGDLRRLDPTLDIVEV